VFTVAPVGVTVAPVDVSVDITVRAEAERSQAHTERRA